MNRRLAAILAADVSSYSRLMGQDEVGTLSAVQAVQLEIIEPALYAMKPDYLAHNLKKKTCK